MEEQNNDRSIMVVKLDFAGNEVWRYPARILDVTPSRLRVEGFFDRDNVALEDLVLKRGDRFVEFYYPGRWYNILEMYDRDDQRLKGWYCNITRPPEIREDQVIYTDLALDLLVYPDGRQVLLDEQEYLAMDLTAEERVHTAVAVNQLQGIFQTLPPVL